jgi:serine/threonine protein kinase
VVQLEVDPMIGPAGPPSRGGPVVQLEVDQMIGPAGPPSRGGHAAQPEASHQDSHGTVLHEALDRGDWTAAQTQLGLHPSAAAQRNSIGWLPLQVAVDSQAPAQLVGLIEASYPLEEWCTTLNAAIKGLNLKTAHSCPQLLTKVIKLVTPAACAERNDFGTLPLRTAITFGMPPALVNAIEAAYPLELWCESLIDAMDVFLAANDAALESCLESHTHLLSKVLSLVTPAACANVQSSAQLPLHHALYHDECPADLTLAILAANPTAAAQRENGPGKRLRTAVEIAIDHSPPAGVLEALIKLVPGELNAAGTNGVSLRDMLASSTSATNRQIGERWGCELERYDVDAGAPIHRSSTAVTSYARDVVRKRRVCLKYMANRQQFETEIKRRFDVQGKRLPADAVIQILAWHMPEGETLVDPTGQTQEKESTPPGADYAYLLVLQQGERSLHDVCQKERLAGYNVDAVLNTFRCVLECVQALHAAGIVHGDLKQRNVLRLTGSAKDAARLSSTNEVGWTLCDMDAAAFEGGGVGSKSSSAYSPPELARHRYGRGTSVKNPSAHPSFDAWSLGVVLYELCSGRTMFAQDTSNDELVDPVDMVRLCTWHTISDEELEPVFQEAAAMHATPETIADAKNLIRWALRSEPIQRPTVAQMLSHRLLNPGARPPQQLPMVYHAFLSHAQADASGTVGTLFHEYKKLGLHNWIDMKQQNLTLEGMRQGVRDSCIFVLILSARVLASWFCQQEMICAIDEEKPIQLILEEEPRFFPFNTDEWNAQAAVAAAAAATGVDPPTRSVSNQNGVVTEVPAKIARVIDACLPRAVKYRRRDFEQRAMMRELCRRNGVVLPQLPPILRRVDTCRPLRVAVIHNPETGSQMLTDLKTAFEPAADRVLLLTGEGGVGLDRDELESADRVLLLLTAGVLGPPPVHHLEAIIEQDARLQQDRIVAAFSEAAGWRFGCDEQLSALPRVKACIDDHEAVAFRPPDPDGPNCHEFPAMVAQLLTKLGTGHVDVAEVASEEMPTASLRQRLMRLEAMLAQRDEELAKEKKKNTELLARLVDFEGEPPSPAGR